MGKTKSDEKSKKNSKGKDLSKSRILVANKQKPDADDIREKANELYHQRIERGEYGSAEEDWIEAEKYFENLVD